jgi:hypothetical protein
MPLPPGEGRHAAINGKHLHGYVAEQAAISRRYRDQGHPKFWGRIIGTSADAESAQWLAAKFKAIGMADVHTQAFDLAPQWMPESWEVSISSGGKTLHFDSAQPDYGSAGTSPDGLDVFEHERRLPALLEVCGRTRFRVPNSQKPLIIDMFRAREV